MEGKPSWLLIALMLSASLVAGLRLQGGARAAARASAMEDVRPLASPGAWPSEIEPAAQEMPATLGAHERELAGPSHEPVPARASRGPAVPREGCTARLSAQITRAGSGTPAELEFLAGLNAGTVLRCDARGELEAGGLYPGFALVRVSAPGIPTLVRELVLRPASSARLELETADRVAVHGRVLDEQGRALAGARVSLDGQVVETDGGGAWRSECVASGPLLIVEHDGYAAHSEVLRPTAPANEIPALDIVLSRGCTLEIDVRGASPGETVQVYVLPRGGQRTTARGGQSAVPWHLVDPVLVVAGVPCTLHDLPPGRAEVVALHALGEAKSGVQCLLSGKRTRVELELHPRPRLAGRVLRDGEPVAGARVVLEAANRLRACAASMSGAEEVYRFVPLVELPAALQATETDRAGGFVLGDWGDAGGERYLTVTSPDAALQVTQRLGRSKEPRIIELAALPRAAAHEPR